jgi:hypothetical protein
MRDGPTHTYAVGKVSEDDQQDLAAEFDVTELADAVKQAKALVSPGKRIYLLNIDTGDGGCDCIRCHSQRAEADQRIDHVLPCCSRIISDHRDRSLLMVQDSRVPVRSVPEHWGALVNEQALGSQPTHLNNVRTRKVCGKLPHRDAAPVFSDERRERRDLNRWTMFGRRIRRVGRAEIYVCPFLNGETETKRAQSGGPGHPPLLVLHGGELFYYVAANYDRVRCYVKRYGGSPPRSQRPG